MPPVEEPQEKQDIKTFTPKRNDSLADIELSDAQVEEKKSLKKAAEEGEILKKEAEEKSTAKPVDKHEDDFVTPDARSFNLDEPLSLEDGILPSEKPSPRVDDISAKKEENSGIRSQIEEANKRAKAATEHAESLKLANENLLKEVEQARSGLTEAHKKLTFQDPSKHPDVQKLVKPWDDDLNALAKEMSLSGSDGARLKADASMLVQQFQQLGESGSQGYDERKEELMDQIETAFPDDRREVIRILNRGASIMDNAEALMQSISQNGSEYEQGQALEIYEAMNKDYSELEKGFFNPTEEMKTSSPYLPVVIHSDYIQSDESLRERSLQTKNYIRRAFLPLPPLSRNETRGMSDQEVATYNQERTAKHRADQLKIRDMAAPAFFSHALLPLVQNQLDKALLQLKEIRDANPKPKSEDEVGGGGGEEEKVTNIKNFDPGRPNVQLD